MQAPKNTLVLYCGGTIGMVPGIGGLAPCPLSADVLAHGFGAGFCFDLVALNPLIDSAEATLGDWQRIALALEAPGYGAVIVLHGTDTLAYTAAVLAELFGASGVPIVVTGSQLPLGAAGSDAPANLALARTVAEAGRPGVMVAFGGRVLDGGWVAKVSSERFAAFDSPNRPWIAEERATGLCWHAGPVMPGERRVGLAPCPVKELKFETGAVLALRLAPGMALAGLEECLAPPVKALLVELYGVGTGPSRSPALRALLARAHERAIVVVGVSQCPHGGVRIATYAAGSAFAAAGMIEAGALSFEATYVRLHLLIARGLAGADLAAAFTALIAG